MMERAYNRLRKKFSSLFDNDDDYEAIFILTSHRFKYSNERNGFTHKKEHRRSFFGFLSTILLVPTDH